MVAWNEDRAADRKHVVGLRLFNIQLAKGKALSPHEFMPFPWDDEGADDGGLSEMTPEERKASLEELKKKLIDW